MKLKSVVFKRSIVIDGRRTSVNLEDVFWNALRDIAQKRQETLSHLIASIVPIGSLLTYHPRFVYSFCCIIWINLLDSANCWSSGKYLFNRKRRHALRNAVMGRAMFALPLLSRLTVALLVPL